MTRIIELLDWQLILPQRPSPTATTILYLLDGNAAMARLDPDWLQDRDDLIVVGLGHGGASEFDLERRSRDYTPMPPPGWTGGVRRATDRPHGGADGFLRQLKGEIVPAAENALGVKPVRRVLWGHSYGGLFGLFALARGIEGFNEIHAASPSLWWGDGMIEAMLETCEAEDAGVRQVALYAGAQEVSRTGDVMSDHARLGRVAGLIEQKFGASVATTIYPEASHGQTFAMSLAQMISSL